MQPTALDLHQAALDLGRFLQNHQASLCTAESCTGGWLAQCITDIAGSSAWFDRGFITYSNAAKTDMLAVPATSIARYGAVSAEVAQAMTQGALNHSQADYALAITGIAGPSGGSKAKPIGTVYIAWQKKQQPAMVSLEHFSGDRQAVRQQAVYHALRLILDAPMDKN